MKTAAMINPDHSVNIILYNDRGQAVRKVWVFPDGRVSFRDYGDPKKSQEFVVLAPVKRK